MKTCPQCQRSYPVSFAICPQDGARLTESLEWAEGTVIRGKYRIVGKIGEGGMGAVYKALHMHFNESCALKVMAPQLMNDSGLVKRFGREAIIARKLRHRNAVKVEDFDETEDGRPFIVMEYIEGQSLKNLMNAQGPLPVARTSSIIKQAAAALDAAHQLGLVHRDIKPDNIVLVVSNGEEVAKVLDFGIAKIRDSQSTSSGMALTATGMVIGTPPYMSPEQAKGADSEELDGRSDIYSLGVVMYQMLTGVLPLKADTPLNMLFAQIQTPPTPIFEARPGVKIPGPIGELVMKCLEKDRARRPQTGRDLIEALEQCERAGNVPAGSSTHAKPHQDFSESTTIPETPARFADGTMPLGATAYADQPTVRTPTASQSLREPATPRVPHVPTVPAAAAHGSSLESDSAAAASSASASSSSSRGMVLGLVAVLVLAVAGGGWYFTHRSPAVSQPDVSAPQTSSSPAAVQPPSTQPNSTQPGSPEVTAPPADSHGSEKATERKVFSNKVAETPKPKRTAQEAASSPPQETDAQKAARQKTVSDTTSLGDLYFQNGEYDNAIKEYQQGLQADPSNAPLQDKLARARKAKDAGQTTKTANP
ncbi:MAG: protein kinase [Candidatus Acidiferrum sp.]